MFDVRLLDLFAMGVVVLDADARVRVANGRARRVLEAREGIELADGRLVTVRREDGASLARLLGEACPPEQAGGLHTRGAMQIARGAARTKLALLVAHVHAGPAMPAGEFVIFLHEPDGGVVVSETILVTLHGLTRAEARITALLVRGRSVAAIAAEVGSSTNTVRTHLKRVFLKLDVASQGALIRAVLSGPAALPLNGDRHGARIDDAS